MAWVAVHENGYEGIFSNKPTRGGKLHLWYDGLNDGGTSYDTEIPLPKGSIKKLIGRNLTWNDEPVELKQVEEGEKVETIMAKKEEDEKGA